MSIKFEELPDWAFEVTEVSAGVYRVTGQDKVGRRVVAEGLDPDACLQDCRASALAIFRDSHKGQTS